MQTFLPYADFQSSARCLDKKRLGKQRVEALQLLKALVDPSAKGWKHHPATKMWKGYELALAVYGSIICTEWVECGGYRDTCKLKILKLVERAPNFSVDAFSFGLQDRVEMPTWLGDPEFHASHRSNLLRKDPIHYGKFGWTESHDLPYIWPQQTKRKQEAIA